VFRRQLNCCPLDGAPVVPLPGDPLVGTILIDRFRIDQVDGDTRTRRIYRATDLTAGRRVSVQVLYGELASARDRRRRFAREAEIGSLFEHPNVLEIVEHGISDDGLPFLVTAAVEARSLEALLREQAPLSPDRAARLGASIAAALEHIHGRKVMHLGLKPTVIALEVEPERLMVAGFQRALRCGERFDCAPPRSLGTAPYVAPEQVRGAPDKRSDLFSLGVILYRMLCGELPFAGTPVQIAVANDTIPVPRIFDRVPGFDVDPELEAIALRLTARDPGDRFADAAAAHLALTRR
jgi:serine/threonine-protein kinase